ncbi:MAG: hypothetical protein NTX86_00815 [Candidatus Dependentiae bacterium]|nr:hypothetical protein [Candidatus Dependentiae bacterium]
MSTLKNARILRVLISKDLKMIAANVSSIIIDCIPPLIVQVTTFGYLFPLLGTPSAMIAPTYLGSMTSLLFHLGYAFVLKTSFNLEHDRFIDYHLTLPIPKRWLFASFIINHMLEVAIVTLPLFTIGVGLLHTHFNLAAISWLGIAIVYPLILAYFSTFFLAFSYSLSLSWIMANSWPRILAPMWWIGATLVVWKKVYLWQPWIAYCMLLNPITYAAEGIRAAFLGNQDFIPWPLCAVMLSIFIVFNCVCLVYGVKKRLDPV